MNLFEMLSFDFKEFVTSPAGILIIVGIICLLVGIVMFLKEGKKAKPTEEVKKDEVAVSDKPAEQNEQTVDKKENSLPETPVVVPSTSDGVVEAPVPVVPETLNITEPTPVVEAPAVVPSVPVEPTPVAPVIETPVVETPVVETPAVVPSAPVEPTLVPVVESLDSAPEQPTVYGGASPEVNLNVVPEQPREIYGGANPLENTAPIPTTAVNEAYNGASPVVDTSEQVIESPKKPIV